MATKLSDKLTFGKYKGQILEDIIISDPTYIKWSIENIDWFVLDNEAYALFISDRIKESIVRHEIRRKSASRTRYARDTNYSRRHEYPNCGNDNGYPGDPGHPSDFG